MVDVVINVEKETTAEEVNNALKDAANEELILDGEGDNNNDSNKRKLNGKITHRIDDHLKIDELNEVDPEYWDDLDFEPGELAELLSPTSTY